MSKEKNHLSASLIIVVLFLSFFYASISSAFLLPDTGQTKCYSNKGKGKLITCPPPGQPLAQDGSYTINPPSYIVNNDGTLFDNNTWLMWQEQDDGIPKTWDQANIYCEDLTFGGYDDWRLPTKKELASIINYGRYNPAIDTTAFLSAKSGKYWSVTKYAGNINYSWNVDFSNGSIIQSLDSNSLYTRCVRGGPLEFNNSEFEKTPDGSYLLVDKELGLMWYQSEILSNYEIIPMDWGTALNYCENSTLGGYTDWRLPNARELESLADDSRYNPALDKYLFSQYDNTKFYYWTSTPSSANTDNRWTVSFQDSSTTTQNKLGKNIYVRCVRSEPSDLIDSQEIKIIPSSLDFGYLKSGESGSLAISISNTGRNSLSIGNISYPSAPFSVTSDECSGKTLSVWQSCALDINVIASVNGIYTDKITVPSNDADYPDSKVNMGVTVNTASNSFRLPDTGQMLCFDFGYTGGIFPEWYSASCSSSPAQDGSYDINCPFYSNPVNEVVNDFNTGLMWQSQEDGMMRGWEDAIEYCNNLSVGGFTGWRLPTKRELLSIVDYGYHGDGSPPLINSWAFPNTTVGSYWTSSESSDTKATAWSINFRYGTSQRESKMKFGYALNYARCVRGGGLPSAAFIDNGNGTITDAASSYMWQQNEGGTLQWNDATAYCENQSLGGYSDWRLPNVKELGFLVDLRRYSPSVDTHFFTGAQPNLYWTSTTAIYCDDYQFGWDIFERTYAVDFSSGEITDRGDRGGGGGSFLNVRCVRGGNTWLMDSCDIKVDPSSINFGSIEAGAAITQNLTISNIGTGDLIIGQITSPSLPFTIISDGCSGQTLPTSASCTVTIKFAPLSTGTYSGNISIPSNDADNPNVTVSLSGTAVPAKAILTGTVTDSSTGLPISNVSVTVTDSVSAKTTSTGSNGVYTITGLTEGSYTAVFSKSGYITKTVSGTLIAGQTQTIDIQLNTAPSLAISITSPLNGTVLNSSSVTVTGSVSNSATVTVNGVQATVSNGIFTASVSLSEGQNTITATATDQYGQTATQGINVSLITKGSITGTVTDSLTGLPISSATVSITDSINISHTALTDNNGIYTINNISQGGFSGSINKDLYITYNISGTITPGQTVTINAALNHAPPLISNVTVINITTDSATISWTTDQLSSTQFEYGTTTAYGNTFSDQNLSTGYTVNLTGLTASTTYHFRITSTNAYSVSSSSGDQTFTTMSPPAAMTLTITSPSDASTINKSDIMVKGTIINTIGNETGVVVNGVVATVYGNTFTANHIPLTEGQNTITVTATDTVGNTATTSITVNAVTTGNYIQLNSNIESGIAPLEVILRVDSSFTMNSPMLYSQGPAPMETVDCPNYENCKVRFTAEGIYTLTAEAKDAQNITYTDSISIVVLNKNQLDTLLKGKWEGMKGALAGGNINEAVINFDSASQGIYRDQFIALSPILPDIVNELNTALINMVSVENRIAEYEILVTREGTTFSLHLKFVRYDNGLWKIWSF